MKRTINISISSASDALANKDKLEGYCFALMLKTAFVNSEFYNPTISNIKKVFHLGTDKSRRVLSNGIKYGYIVKTQKGIKANISKPSNEYAFSLTFKLRALNNKRGGHCYYTIKEIESLVRRIVLVNHINKQTDCLNQFKVMDGEAQSTKQLRNAKKRIAKMSNGKAYDGLSLNRISKIIKGSYYLSRKAVNVLVNDGIVSKKMRIEETSVPTCENNPNDREINRDFAKNANTYFKEIGECGYLYYDSNKGKIMCRLSDSYCSNECAFNLIKFIK